MVQLSNTPVTVHPVATATKTLTISDIQKSDLDWHLFSATSEINWFMEKYLSADEMEFLGDEWFSFFAYHDGKELRAVYVYDGVLPLHHKEIRCIRPYTFPDGTTRNP